MIFPVEYIPILNGLVVFLFIFCIYSGYKQGFLLKAIGCIGFLAVGFISWFLAPYISNILSLFPKELTPLKDTILSQLFYRQLNTMCVFAILFILLSIIVVCLKPFLKIVCHIPILSQINRCLGVVFGFVQGFIVISVVCLLFRTPLFSNGGNIVQQSLLKPVSKVSDSVLFFANDYFSQLESVQKLLTPSHTLDNQDWDAIASWLSSQNINGEEIERFIQSIRGK